MSRTQPPPSPPSSGSASASAELNVARIREEFPILASSTRGKPLVYLDNAATTQKPRQVLETLDHFYRLENANIHRGVYYLSSQATASYDRARARIAKFIGARFPEEVVFVRGATEAVNLVAHSFARPRLRPGDNIVVTHLEHHANFVPWQQVCHEKQAEFRVAPVTDAGDLDLGALDRLLDDRTRILALVHLSNALGTVNPAEKIIALAHAKGVPVLLDAAQSLPHLPVDVGALGCDFLVASGHKLYGPTGIGLLYGRLEHLDSMPPYQTGGDMIELVSIDQTTFQKSPARFEAGTPHIAGAVGLAAAVAFLEALGLEAVARREDALVSEAVARLEGIPGLTIVGRPERRAGAVSFVMDGIHPHDIGTILDSENVAIRAGHHCAQPLMRRLGLNATARASFSFYNTAEEVAALEAALRKARSLFH
ncbi:MAG: SufS family cysteine desulfurase [Puniceicoccaceae bacterium]|nr:MAG: SufS family cysteine desulfurase [Puniceicoccaceae bacterium]